MSDVAGDIPLVDSHSALDDHWPTSPIHPQLVDNRGITHAELKHDAAL